MSTAIALPSVNTFTFDDVVSPYMGVFFAAFLVALIVTPFMAALARRLGIVDRPDNRRKLHTEPIAYLGGLALFAGWIAGVFASRWAQPHSAALDPEALSIHLPLELVLGAAVVVLVGLWDDVRGMRARYKLLGQVAAGLVLAVNGVGMRLVTGALGALGSFLNVDLVGFIPTPVLAVISGFLVMFFVVGGCNATNLMDGLDGLASGVTAIVTLGLTAIAIALATGMYDGGGAYSLLMDPVRMVFCLALLGAVMGFLPYNFKPATIFMGDTGSMLLGYLCVSIILLFGERGDPLLVMAGLTVFTLPIMDTALAIVRRKMHRMPITSADSHHLHHLLTRSGLGVRQAVIAMYGITMGFGLLGFAMIFIRLRFVAAVFMVIFAFIIIMAYKIAHRQHVLEQRTAALRASVHSPPAPVAVPALAGAIEAVPVAAAPKADGERAKRPLPVEYVPEPVAEPMLAGRVN